MTSLPTSRTNARERALELLYEAHAKSSSVADVLAALSLPPDLYARTIAVGADEHFDDGMALIAQFTRGGWSVDRLPLLDVLILRIAIEELQHQPNVPRAVVMDEAVELAKNFSTEESSSFVNGILESIAGHLGR
jgi:transcription antitermination protein NusB